MDRTWTSPSVFITRNTLFCRDILAVAWHQADEASGALNVKRVHTYANTKLSQSAE